MTEITKKEKDYLESKGCKFPEDLYHSVGKGRKRSYSATESPKVLKLLTQYRNSIIVK